VRSAATGRRTRASRIRGVAITVKARPFSASIQAAALSRDRVGIIPGRKDLLEDPEFFVRVAMVKCPAGA
jgi:hypothetical protein